MYQGPRRLIFLNRYSVSDQELCLVCIKELMFGVPSDFYCIILSNYVTVESYTVYREPGLNGSPYHRVSTRTKISRSLFFNTFVSKWGQCYGYKVFHKKGWHWAYLCKTIILILKNYCFWPLKGQWDRSQDPNRYKMRQEVEKE